MNTCLRKFCVSLFIHFFIYLFVCLVTYQVGWLRKKVCPIHDADSARSSLSDLLASQVPISVCLRARLIKEK